MINGSWFVSSDPVGSIDGNQFQTDSEKRDINFFQKRNKNYFRNTDPTSPYDYYNIDNTHTSIQLNNLQNYNPTSKGITYYEPHETEKLLHLPTSKPRFQGIIMRDNSIVNEIQKNKKQGIHYHSPPHHSFGLTPV